MQRELFDGLTNNIRKTLLAGLFSLTQYVLVLILIIMLPLANSWYFILFCNVVMFVAFMNGFSFFIEIFAGIEFLVNEGRQDSTD